jgi:hypothetical protein
MIISKRPITTKVLTRPAAAAGLVGYKVSNNYRIEKEKAGKIWRIQKGIQKKSVIVHRLCGVNEKKLCHDSSM